ncbi:MAG: hypothetical protein WC322_06370, partial [Candidatus Paceibacterota bacterium]
MNGRFLGDHIEGFVVDKDGYSKLQTGGRQLENTIMMTTQRAHDLSLGGQNVLRWKLRTDAGRGAYYQGMTQAAKVQAQLIRGFRNVRNFAWRGPMTDLTTLATYGRVTAVGSGALVLRGKHTIVDPSRNIAEIGLQSLNHPKVQKDYAAALELITDKQVLDYVRLTENAGNRGDLFYNIEGGFRTTRVAVKAFDSSGKLKNFDKAEAAIRRITADGGFTAYVEGGEAGFDAWLNSAEGHRLIIEGRHTTRARKAGEVFAHEIANAGLMDSLAARKYVDRAKEVLKEHDFPSTKERVEQLAKDMFKVDALQMYQGFLNFKNLGESLKKMAKGEMSRTPDSIRNALEEAYRAVDENGNPLYENPTLDLPFDTGGGYTDFFTSFTKWAMTPNKNARAMCYKTCFEKIMKEQMKEGAPPNDAAVIAADWALRATNRVHFDLSQAWRVESKFRWFAWFATKHRKWNTWLARSASKYPGYAMAVEEFLQWMDERNEDDSIPMWEKHFIKAGRLSMNLAPWTWLSHYCLESWMGIEAERGVSFLVNQVPGIDAEPSPYAFDTTFQDIALPRLGKALTDFLWIKNTPLVTGEWDETTAEGREALRDAWEESIDSLPDKEREDFIEKVEINYAYRKSAGDDPTWFDCIAAVAKGKSISAALSLLKPMSTRLLSAEESRYQADMKLFYATIKDDPDGASDFFYEHPDFAMAIGAGELMPWDHEKFSMAMRSYQELCRKYSDQIGNLYKTGRLRTNPEDADRAYDEFIREVQVLKERDATGYMARMFEYTGEDAFLTSEDAKYTVPLMTRDEWYEVAKPEASEIDLKRQELMGEGSAYVLACEAANIDPELQRNTLLGKLYYARYVQDPLDEYQNIYPGVMTSGERGQYETLFNTTSGKQAADQYMSMALSDKKRQMLLTGLTGGKFDPSNLFYAVTSPRELDFLGFKTTAEAQKRWEQYAQMRAAIWQWQSLTPGMTTSSGAYREAIKDLDEGFENIYASKSSGSYDEQFAYEWEFSRMHAHERLRAYGIG